MSTHYERPPLNASFPALLAAVEDSFLNSDLFHLAQAIENPPPNSTDENNQSSNENYNEPGEDEEISVEDIEDLEATAAGSGSSSGFSPPIDVNFGGNSGNVGSQSQTSSYSNENSSPGSDEEPFFDDVDNPPRSQNDGFNDEFMVNEAGLWTEGSTGSDVDCLYGDDKQSQGEFSLQFDSCSECSICDGQQELSATMTTGNVLLNDDLGTDPASIVRVAFGSVNYTPDENGIITVTTLLGELMLYTRSFDDNIAGDFKYTLYDNGQHPDGDSNNKLYEDFLYTLSDAEGDSGSAFLRITIVDDIPCAVDDPSINVIESDEPINGNVLSNDIHGADQPVLLTSFSYDDDSETVLVPSGDSTTVTTALGGILTVLSNGDWEYTPPDSVDNSDGRVPDHFTYTIIDNDGDTDSAQQQLFIEDGLGPSASDDGFLINTDPFDQLYTVYESGLTGGSGELPNDTATQGNVLVNDSDGNEPASITQIEFDSVLYTPDSDGIIFIDTPGGSLTLFTEDFDIYSAGDFQYLLDAALDQTGAPDDTVFEDFEYTLADSDGSSSLATLRVGIVEDLLPPLPDVV